ncbi:MAG TPA: NlpC/P60 family protein [Acidimicrobiales bacterium]
MTRPAGADQISQDRAKAAQIEAALTQAQATMSTLSQQYDAASDHLKSIQSSIASTKATITSDKTLVSKDRVSLSKAAIANYVSGGSAGTGFFENNKTQGVALAYSQVAEGDINLAVSNLHTAENTLNAEESQLQGQQASAQTEVNAEQAAVQQNAAVESQQQQALNQETGAIANLVAQQQQQQEQAAQRTAVATIQRATGGATLAGLSQAAPPPTAAGGAGAVQAARSQIGVPYRWGGEDPKGSSDPGFDCSGLTAWSWGQVGVGLPHYSGSQMSDSAPVPLSDLQPGDLLFYGPGGSEHVAMYIGGGQMIEAPYTGASVWITSARFGDGFVGAGRP